MDIFISYKAERKAAAAFLADLLKAHGYSVWWDDQLRVGDDWGKVIDAQLRGAKAAVIIWCSKACNSRWVRAEAERASAQGALVPIKLEPCDLPMPYDIDQTLDLTDWDCLPESQLFERLLDAVAAKVGRPAERDKTKIAAIATDRRKLGANRLTEFPLGRFAPAASSTLPSVESPPPKVGGASKFSAHVRGNHATFNQGDRLVIFNQPARKPPAK